jgi:hypothetical protein
MTNTLHAFGDSFIVGDQDDFLHQKDPNVKPTHKMQYSERLHFIKYNISFVSILAKHYRYDLENYAVRGSGNYPQLDRLWAKLTEGKIKSGDIVLFGLTTMERDRVLLHRYSFDSTVNEFTGPCLIDRDLISKEQMVANGERPILERDFYYITATLTQLSEQFNVPIIKFNLWDNALYNSSEQIKNVCKVKDFVGYDVPGNTVIDILNDTWGTPTIHPFHTDLKIQPAYEHLYTYYRHPSVEGHKKIAQWWIDNQIIEKSTVA